MKYSGKYMKKRIPAFTCAILLFCSQGITARADQNTIEARLESQRAMTVQSNEVPNWPTGPVVSSESAILMELETGTILYAKNIHNKEYPASTTKILTSLIASEQCSLDEMVSFSHDAVFDTPRNSNHIAMDVGQKLTMEQCLNAILIRSANEVSYAVAEHISHTTDWSVFAEMMNKRAAELGALNSHFVNPNGLPDEEHYTTAYDLAMIGRAFFSNELLCSITLTKRMEIPASPDTIPVTKLENNAMQIIPGGTYGYDYLVGCKTGFTETARYSLVSCAEKDGMKLICVVMKDESPNHYEDTISLFNYGFSNFQKVNVSQTDTRYNMEESDMFYGGSGIFGDSSMLLSLNEDDVIILPRTLTFKDVDSSISYHVENSDYAAVITYSYQGVDIGTVRVCFAADNTEDELFETPEETEDKKSSVVFVNILRILLGIAVVVAVLFVAALIRVILKRYSISLRKRNQTGWKSARQKKRKRRRRRR